MRYLGGKGRIARDVATFIASRTDGCTAYYEPFVGSAAIISQFDQGMPRYASDASLDLILMFQALQQGWMPPCDVPEEMYAEQRVAPPSALRGFVGYGCSWSGKFFGGYARGEGRNYAREAAKSVCERAGHMRDVVFTHCHYADISIMGRALIYCDPPYAGTTMYAQGAFDSDYFWQQVRVWSGQGHMVLVSEYAAPDDFDCVWQQARSTNIRPKNGNEQRIEKIFIHNGTCHYQPDRTVTEIQG